MEKFLRCNIFIIYLNNSYSNEILKTNHKNHTHAHNKQRTIQRIPENIILKWNNFLVVLSVFVSRLSRHSFTCSLPSSNHLSRFGQSKTRKHLENQYHKSIIITCNVTWTNTTTAKHMVFLSFFHFNEEIVLMLLLSLLFIPKGVEMNESN